MSDAKVPDWLNDVEGITFALARAQLKFPTIEKNRENAHFKSKYADLSAVLAAVRPVLAAEGIAFTQTTEVTDAGVELVTSLLHGSERLQSRWPLDIYNVGPQQIGSLLSYMRRYQACSLLGVAADDDDDGNAAQAAPVRSFQGLAAADKPPVDSNALAVAHPPDKPIAAMTVRELIDYAREIGVPVSGSKTDMVRTLEPYVLAATGEEPWDMSPVEGEGVAAASDNQTIPAPSRPEPEAIPFSPVVATGSERMARNSSQRAD